MFSTFKFAATLSLAATVAFGCAPTIGSSGDRRNDDIIGEKLQSASAMSDRTSTLDRTEIALFDKVTRLVHQFDVTNMKVVRTLAVDNPSAVHSVLFDQPSGLVVDLSEGHISLFDRAGSKTTNPVQMAGRPKSAAFNPTSGYLVVYDDTAAVGLVKFNSNGEVVDSWTGGPVITDGSSLRAGDLLDNGTLVLALEDGSLAKVDVDTAITNRRWGTVPQVATSLGEVSWVAPVRNRTDRVLVSSKTAVALISLADGSTISSQPISASDVVTMRSKKTDAHVIIKNGNQTAIIYTDGLTVKRQTTRADAPNISSSRLCLSEDSWTIVEGLPYGGYDPDRRAESEFTNRSIKKFRLSDLLAQKRKTLPDGPEVDVSAKYAFALFRSELGHGVRMSLLDDSEKTVDGFNAPYIH